MTCYRHQGKWRYDFTKNGIRYRGSGYTTKQEAKDAEAEERKKIGKINTDFLHLCEKRLEEVEGKRTKRHFKANKRVIDALIPKWGNKKEVKREDVEDYLAEVAKESPSKANRHLRLIKALFNHGIDREWFTYNPAGKVKKFPVAKVRKYVPPVEDVLKVLSLAKKEDRLYILLIIHTLARVGEINQLKWEDVKEDHLTLWTRKARNSDLTPRDIPLNETLKAVIEQIPKVGEYVFMNKRTKKPYDYRDKFMVNLCKTAKVKNFTYHCLRHLGASILSAEGAGLTDIQAILGHQRATTTDNYLQSLKGGTKEAVKILDRISPIENPMRLVKGGKH